MKHPHADGTLRIDNSRLETLITSYKTGTDRATALSEIVTLTQDRALTLIRYHKTAQYAGRGRALE